MEYTLEEMQNSMTIVFNKRTGSIKATYGGIQDMDILYGEESEDYKLIWDLQIFEKDQYVLDNIQQFKVNIETKQLELLPNTVNKYPIAST